MKLELKAKHFKNTEYLNFKKGHYCAIEKALKTLLPKNTSVIEGATEVGIDGVDYKHAEYDYPHFSADKDLAKTHNYDNTIIRVINIPKLKL